MWPERRAAWVSFAAPISVGVAPWPVLPDKIRARLDSATCKA